MAVITIIRKKRNLDFSDFQAMTLSCDKNVVMLVKRKKRTEWNSSGKNVNICGDHFLTGTSSPQNSRIFLEWKFLSFDESSYKLKNLRMIDIDSFSLKLLHLWYLINLVRERVAWISGNKTCPTVKLVEVWLLINSKQEFSTDLHFISRY